MASVRFVIRGLTWEDGYEHGSGQAGALTPICLALTPDLHSEARMIFAHPHRHRIEPRP